MVMIAALIGITLLGALVTFMANDRYAARLATAISSIPALLSVWMYWQWYQHFQGAGNALLTPGEAAFVQQILGRTRRIRNSSTTSASTA